MPQLDTVTFMSQYFWFVLIFLLLYFRIVVYYLPNIARSLKLRYKLRNKDQTEIARIDNLNTELASSIERVMSNSLSLVNNGITEVKKASETALNKATSSFNANPAVSSANTFYLNSLINLHIKTYILGRLTSKISK